MGHHLKLVLVRRLDFTPELLATLGTRQLCRLA
jgi:hypothetical protein